MIIRRGGLEDTVRIRSILEGNNPQVLPKRSASFSASAGKMMARVPLSLRYFAAKVIRSRYDSAASA